MTLEVVDLTASYFKYTIPTPIYCTSVNKALKILKVKLRANASSVVASLKEGDYDYLGLLFTNIKYTGLATHPPCF